LYYWLETDGENPTITNKQILIDRLADADDRMIRICGRMSIQEQKSDNDRGYTPKNPTESYQIYLINLIIN